MIEYCKGFLLLLEGFGLINRSGIRRFVVVPLFINMGIFAGVIYWLSSSLDEWIDELLPWWLSWLEWLLWPLFFLVMVVCVYYTFALLINLIAAPFNSKLAEKTETVLTGVEPAYSSARPLLLDIRANLGSECRKLLYYMKFFVPLLIVTVIPGLNVIAIPLWFLFAAWSLAIEYLDYPMANHGLMFQDVLAQCRSRRMLSLGFGSAVFLCNTIPLLNFIAMPVAVASATRVYTKQFKPARDS